VSGKGSSKHGSLTSRAGTFAEPAAPRRAHLIGIGGSGMRSLAQTLIGWGWRLTGSDRALEATQGLSAQGVVIHAGHAPAHLPEGTDLVISSDAVPPDNPELRRAREMGLPAKSYFAFLGDLMATRRGVAVAGTHGKSTTAAMAASLLVRAGLDPTVVYGAAMLGAPAGGRAGRGDLMLVEACEYRENFLHLSPRHAAILNIEHDHFDCYPTFDRLERAFTRFAESLPPDGVMLAAEGCPIVGRVARSCRCAVETFGRGRGAAWRAVPVGTCRGRCRFEIVHRGRSMGEVRLRVAGRHNVLNALAAAALAWHNGVAPDRIASGLSRFPGLRRRLEMLGTYRGIVLIDDYAHHPTELNAALEAVRRWFPGRRLWCVFQPHQASRTRRLAGELAAGLTAADKAVVCDVFRARDPAPRPDDVTAACLAARARAVGGDVADVHAIADVIRYVSNQLAPGDVLLTAGAGDVRKVCDGLLERLREDRAAG
jgi:UDP-N-acetylmuramate--alanine ligase